MKRERVLPNLLTYSTLIDLYSKGGLYREAMEVFREFKSVGLRGDVVLYSTLIDALCKSGLVGSDVSLIDEMTKEGISPNVVTYNSIIDAFGRSATMESRDGLSWCFPGLGLSKVLKDPISSYNNSPVRIGGMRKPEFTKSIKTQVGLAK
ncbi:hypothetical protein YC2023_050062 [Brassica napus]